MRVADRAQQRDQQLEVRHRGLVDDQQVGLELVVGRALGRAPSRARSGSSRRRSPVDSAIRRAARPVGATSAIDAFCASAAAQISRIVAVLPVPGPPVTIDSREPNAASHRRRLLGRGHEVAASSPRARRSDGVGAGERADALRQLGLERRGLRPVGPDRRRRLRARARPASCIVASSSARRRRAEQLAPPLRASSGTGRHVEPSRSASPSTWITPARARAGDADPTPAARAIVSAIWNPTPNTLVSSYGRCCTTSCARSPYSLAIRGHEPRRARAAPAAGAARGSSAAPCQDLIASFTRRGFSPANGTRPAGRGRSRPARRRRSASSSRAARVAPTCLTRRRYAAQRASPDGATGSATRP